MFDSILVAVDGSEHGHRAARMAADLARMAQAKQIRMVVAFDPIPSFLGEPGLSRAMAARTNAAEEIAAGAKATLADSPAEIHTEILEGPPAEAILQVAATRKPDVIVMGSRGLGRLQGALLGSNSQKVVAHAACPVLIVR